MVEALAELGEREAAQRAMDEILEQLCQRGNVEIFNEMFDIHTQNWLGNMPQGLSHLSLVCAANALADANPGHRV